MYLYKRAAGRYKNYLPGFHLVDISKYQVCDLEKLFNILTIVVYDDFYKREIAIELDVYRDSFAKSTETIQGFLDTLKNQQLTYHTRIPEDKYSIVRWESMPHQGFYHYPANINLANDRQDELTSDYAPDIKLKAINLLNVDYKNISEHCLFIMNGCLVRSFGNKDAIYLLNAGKDFIAKKQDVYISALNFERIGKVQTIPITKDNLKVENINDFVRFQIVLDKNINLDNKTIWLSFNGQICFDESIIARIGLNKLEFYHEQIDCYKHHFNYSERTRTPKWTLQSKKVQYINDALLMDNSFVIIIDNPTVGVELDPVIDYKYPGAFQTEYDFKYPVITANGLFPYIYRMKYSYNGRVCHTDIVNNYEYVIDSVYRMSTDLVYDDINQGQSGDLLQSFILKITGIKYVG